MNTQDKKYIDQISYLINHPYYKNYKEDVWDPEVKKRKREERKPFVRYSTRSRRERPRKTLAEIEEERIFNEVERLNKMTKGQLIMIILQKGGR